jgi:hypothetical protein
VQFGSPRDLISQLSVSILTSLHDPSLPVDTPAIVRCEKLRVLHLTLPFYSSRHEQTRILMDLRTLVAFRDPSRNKSFLGGGLSELELRLCLDPCDYILSQLDEHLAQWESCGVKKAWVFNSGGLVSGFGERAVLSLNILPVLIYASE